jgi:hypothetical protein
MYSYKLNTFVPQLQEILTEAQKHLGKVYFFSNQLKMINF